MRRSCSGCWPASGCCWSSRSQPPGASRARIESPLADLLHAVERLSAGDWVTHIEVPTGRVGGALGSALERLRINLSDHAATGRALDIMLDSMNDAVFITSPEGLIKRVNLAATQLFGWSQMELLGRELAYVISDQDRPNFSIEQAANEMLELTMRTQAGQTVPVSLSGSVMASEDPRFQGCIFVARNITERKRAERRIRYLARYDTLTKIPNRLQFQHSLQQAIARTRRAGRELALIYLDLDRFKEVNDTFGHAAGDRALEILSERMNRKLTARHDARPARGRRIRACSSRTCRRTPTTAPPSARSRASCSTSSAGRSTSPSTSST